MCKGCRMDPKDVDNLYSHQGAVDIDDFDKEVNYRPKKKNKPKAVRGCPGNDSGPHVYVWTTEFEPTGKYTFKWSNKVYSSFYEEHGFHQYERKICIGCERKAAYRETEEFKRYRDKWRRKNPGKRMFYRWWA